MKKKIVSMRMGAIRWPAVQFAPQSTSATNSSTLQVGGRKIRCASAWDGDLHAIAVAPQAEILLHYTACLQVSMLVLCFHVDFFNCNFRCDRSSCVMWDYIHARGCKTSVGGEGGGLQMFCSLNNNWWNFLRGECRCYVRTKKCHWEVPKSKYHWRTAALRF